MRLISSALISRPLKRFTSDKRKIDHTARVGDSACDDNFRRLAAAHVENELRREFQTRHHEGRIDCTLEAEARVRM